MAAILVYVTAATLEDAKSIGAAIVGERLAACANVIPGMTSIYRWEGEVRQDSEAVLILKTTEDRLDALTTRVRTLHPYDLPCVVALPIRGGNPAFLDWIAGEVTGGM
jgi:periplasmic divalent cation tolerance protein